MADNITWLALLPYLNTNANVVPVYVRTGDTGTKDGSSWSNAKADVKTTIDAISDASNTKIYLVLVGKGVYQAGSPMAMKNNVSIIGVWSENQDWLRGATDTTVLDGNNKYGVIANQKDNELTNRAVVYGVKIADGKSDNIAGGMYNESSSPTITNVVFAGNNAGLNGGGLYNSHSSPVLANVVFSGNSATALGGGIFNEASSPLLVNVTMAGNVASNNDNQNSGLTSYNNTAMPYIPFVGTSPVNIGIYIKRSNKLNSNAYTLYYSSDKATWYDTPALTGAVVTPPTDAVDLTTLDITGYTRTGRPDAGAWERH